MQPDPTVLAIDLDRDHFTTTSWCRRGRRSRGEVGKVPVVADVVHALGEKWVECAATQAPTKRRIRRQREEIRATAKPPPRGGIAGRQFAAQLESSPALVEGIDASPDRRQNAWWTTRHDDMTPRAHG